VNSRRDHPSHRRIEPAILYFGTPVVLIASLNEDGSANLAPMSSAWALGRTVMLGLGVSGKTLENLQRERECTINLPESGLWHNVEQLAPLTGRNPVPEQKSAQFQFESEKFEAAGLTPQASEMVGPPRVLECRLQLEATIADVNHIGPEKSAAAVEAHVVRVHAAPDLVLPGTNHVDPYSWSPLLYVFRHYVATGEHLGKTFRAER
jgi:flavin reductase (DIM6/NTAB) family NADH-FMN oxidoreductase RutF